MSNPYNVVVVGPLAPYAEGFHAELRALGYRRNASSPQLGLMAHLSRWLEYRGLEPGGIDPGLVDAFLADRRSEGYTMWLSTKGLPHCSPSWVASVSLRLSWISGRLQQLSG